RAASPVGSRPRNLSTDFGPGVDDVDSPPALLEPAILFTCDKDRTSGTAGSASITCAFPRPSSSFTPMSGPLAYCAAYWRIPAILLRQSYCGHVDVVQRLRPKSIRAHWTDDENVSVSCALTMPYSVDRAYKGDPLSPGFATQLV